MKHVQPSMAALALGVVLVSTDPAWAADFFESGKLLATSGVSQVEGAGGGGLAPWALITGYGTRDAIGANAHYTLVNLPNYTLHSGGVALGLYDRVELSYARHWFDTGATGAALGLGAGFTFHQNIFGAKVKVLGDAVYDQDTALPQIAVGAQYKKNDRAAVISLVGGRGDDGIDFYVAATKVFLAQSVLVNGAVRMTKANQFGILGFGGDRKNSYSVQFEGSAAYLVTRKIAIGAEARTKPNNLGFAKENDAWDVFGAYFLNKNASLTLAYVDLGSIATQAGQRGFYLSLQVGF
ncbi:MAG: DUF3034 family protein [Rhodospirillaceae bacterium]